jgi:peptide/nickel transport system ATP-binding protein
MAAVLQIENLAIAFPAADGVVRRVVDGVWLQVEQGDAVGVMGESGCGKSLTALAALRLVPEPGRIVAGSVTLDGEDVLAMTERRLAAVRGGLVGLAFQDAATALDPLRSAGFQVAEAALLHGRASRTEVPGPGATLLAAVGLDAGALWHAYPHQLSGGQRQRVLLASALSGAPRLLIADEPTAALDTVAQRQLADLLNRLREERGLTLGVISHDPRFIERVADQVTVVYAGETVESGARVGVLGQPAHPYTRGLVSLMQVARAGDEEAFPSLPGTVPAPAEWGNSCRFAPRCPMAFEECRARRPALVEITPGRRARCFLWSDSEETVDRA